MVTDESSLIFKVIFVAKGDIRRVARLFRAIKCNSLAIENICKNYSILNTISGSNVFKEKSFLCLFIEPFESDSFSVFSITETHPIKKFRFCSRKISNWHSVNMQ